MMMFNPVKRIRAGDGVIMKLITINGDTFYITVNVKKAQY